jgi:hypothetical protein
MLDKLIQFYIFSCQKYDMSIPNVIEVHLINLITNRHFFVYHFFANSSKQLNVFTHQLITKYKKKVLKTVKCVYTSINNEVQKTKYSIKILK